MKDLTNKTWGEITEEQKEKLLRCANAVSGIDSNTIKDGECIVDFENYDFSIAGKLIDGEIIINENEKFYNPSL